MIAETYWELMRDPAHWLFEITLIVIFDLLIGALLWPFIKRWIAEHDRKKHAHEHCEDAHPFELDEEVKPYFAPWDGKPGEMGPIS